MAVPFVNFPPEINLNIAGFLDNLPDLAALARVCRQTYSIANKKLYSRAQHSHSYVLCWASQFGRLGTVRHLLAAGVGADCRWLFSPNRSPFCLPGDPSLSSPLSVLRCVYGRRGNLGRTIAIRTDSRTPSPPPRWFAADSEERDVEDPQTEDNRGLEIFEAEESSDAIDGVPGHENGEPRPRFPALNLEKCQPTGTVGAGISTTDMPCYLYPLHLAAMGGHVEVAELLLNHGATLDPLVWKACDCVHDSLDRHTMRAYTYEGRGKDNERKFLARAVLTTPLHLALCHRQQEMAKMLVRRRARRTFDDPQFGAHALHTAAAHGCLDAVKALLEGDHAADINVQDSRGLTPLYYAYSSGQRETVLWLLQQKEINVDAVLGAGLTLLHLACLDGAFAFASRLVDAGASVAQPWNENICSLLGPLSPLELCAAVHHTNSRRVYAKRSVTTHQRRFERRRLELMEKLLAALAPTDERRQLQILGSTLSFAAGHRSIPMLELLASSRGVDVVKQATSAIHDAIYPRYMERVEPGPNPLATLRWLAERGAPVECDSELTVDALAAVCELPAGCPWKREVVEWLVDENLVDPDSEVLVCFYWDRCNLRHRTHEIHLPPDKLYHRFTSPFRRALLASDFDTCDFLLGREPRPNLMIALSELARSSEGVSTMSPTESEADESGERLSFLLRADKEETIRHNPDTFRLLCRACGLPPCDIHLTASLSPDLLSPTNPLYRHWPRSSSRRGLISRLLELRDRARRDGVVGDWDRASRLVLFILCQNWNAALFLLRHCTFTSWAQEPGLEYFARVLDALRARPYSPELMGHSRYHDLISRWDLRQDHGDVDVQTALFAEAVDAREPLISKDKLLAARDAVTSARTNLDTDRVENSHGETGPERGGDGSTCMPPEQSQPHSKPAKRGRSPSQDGEESRPKRGRRE